jgi:hypothetical protein
MHSLRSDLTMKNRHGFCGYQSVTLFPAEFPKGPETDSLPIFRIHV